MSVRSKVEQYLAMRRSLGFKLHGDARMLREFLRGELWAPLAGQLGVEDAELRVTLCGSQIVGMVMARHVIGVEPLAALSSEELAALLAPTFQRYLVGELRRS